MGLRARGLVVLDEDGGVPAIRGAVMDLIQQLSYHVDPEPPDGPIKDGDGSVHRRMAQDVVGPSIVRDRDHHLALG